MEETKVDSTTDDLIRELADVLDTPTGQQVWLRRRAALASSDKPSRQLHRMRQYKIGPPLATRCDPESETPEQASHPDEQLQYMLSQFGPPVAAGRDLENTTLAEASQPDEQLQYMLSQFGPSVAAEYDSESATPAQSPVSRQPAEGTPVSRGVLPRGRHSRSEKNIGQLSPALRGQIERELAAVRAAWQRYRSTRSRDAVYFYLEAVFAVVTRWRQQTCAMKNSRAALRLKPRAPKMKPEPFARIIFCTCDPNVADGKTTSKWSRVLRFARKAKPAEQSLTDFIKANGGLNKCARRFAEGTGVSRKAKPRH